MRGVGAGRGASRRSGRPNRHRPATRTVRQGAVAAACVSACRSARNRSPPAPAARCHLADPASERPFSPVAPTILAPIAERFVIVGDFAAAVMARLLDHHQTAGRQHAQELGDVALGDLGRHVLEDHQRVDEVEPIVGEQRQIIALVDVESRARRKGSAAAPGESSTRQCRRRALRRSSRPALRQPADAAAKVERPARRSGNRNPDTVFRQWEISPKPVSKNGLASH